MMYPTEGINDWFTFCPCALEKWGTNHLSNYQFSPRGLNRELTDRIAGIIDNTPEETTLHEMFHSVLIFYIEDSPAEFPNLNFPIDGNDLLLTDDDRYLDLGKGCSPHPCK